MVLESPEHGPEMCANSLTSYPPQCGGLPVDGWDWEAVDNEESSGGTRWGVWQLTGTYRDGRLTLTGPPEAAPPAADPEPEPEFGPACAEPDVVDPGHGMEAWSDAFRGGSPFDPATKIALWVSDPAGGRTEVFVGNVIVRPGAAEQTRRTLRERGYGGRLCVVEQDSPTERQLLEVQDELAREEARAVIGAVGSSHPDGRHGVVRAKVWVADEKVRGYVRSRWGDLVDLTGLLQPVGTGQDD
jgi:hypothetical protein